MKNKTNPGVFIVGGFFRNQNGLPTTQAEELKKLLQRENIQVFFASRHLNRLLRLFDILLSLIFYSRQYTIVNIQCYGGFSLVLEDLASIVAKALGKKLIFTLHGGALPANIKKKKFLYLRVLRRATVITCPSPFLIEQLRPYGLEARLIENSIPLKDYVYVEKEQFKPRLLWMRAFHPVYNPDMALEVLQLLKVDFPDAILEMAGTDYGYETSIKEKAARMGLDGNVRFRGYINQAQKNELAHECDLYLCTNRIDNAPVSLIEMLSMGLAVVSTNVGGIPQLVQDHREALLVASEDSGAMAEAIRQIIQTPALGRSLVVNGRKLVNRFDEPQVSSKWIALLTELNLSDVRYSGHMAL